MSTTTKQQQDAPKDKEPAPTMHWTIANDKFQPTQYLALYKILPHQLQENNYTSWSTSIKGTLEAVEGESYDHR